MRCCSCYSCGVFLNFLLLPQVLGEHGLHVVVLDGELGGVSFNVEGLGASDHSGATWLNHNRGLELGNEFTLLLFQNGVGHEHVVVKALTHADLGSGLVLHSADREGEGGEALVDFDEESASALHLEVVHLVEFALEHGAAGVSLLGLALAGRDVDVETDNIAGAELPLSDLLGALGSVDDHVVAVTQVSADLVGENTLDGVAVELLCHFLDDLGDLVVGGGLANLALGGLEGVPGSEDDIGLASTDGTITDNGSGGGVGGVAIEVCATDATRYNGV